VSLVRWWYLSRRLGGGVSSRAGAHRGRAGKACGAAQQAGVGSPGRSAGSSPGRQERRPPASPQGLRQTRRSGAGGLTGRGGGQAERPWHRGHHWPVIVLAPPPRGHQPSPAVFRPGHRASAESDALSSWPGRGEEPPGPSLPSAARKAQSIGQAGIEHVSGRVSPPTASATGHARRTRIPSFLSRSKIESAWCPPPPSGQPGRDARGRRAIPAVSRLVPVRCRVCVGKINRFREAAR
jgi:hypothetical protein